VETVLKVIVFAAKYLIGWFALPHRVNRIVTNDLPHLRHGLKEVREAQITQAAFCKGVQAGGGCDVEKEEP
jgi:hypothetical protein